MTVNPGSIGIWRPAFQLDAELATEVEKLGYGAIWVGGSPPEDLEIVETLLDATEHIAVATGIVNMWQADPDALARSCHRIEAKHPGRFLLGVGVGHREATQEYQKPYDKIVSYLDALAAADVPGSATVLAALGPRVLRLSAERTAGAHPYLTTPEHTRRAREILGDGVLLAPEQKVVLESDPERARRQARPMVSRYLELTNYAGNLRRLGWTDTDLVDGGSDALIDALAVHGDADTIVRGVRAHLDAGADHVCVQVLPMDIDPLPAYRAIADAMGLSTAV
ncbi:LLM class F420-dependent oxidoreductase [Saccharomonospora sp.]|uniref:LLM class F420-dependent oxidoreductase n=1 Tax=Saccharomonospora sp. TaxID=33913 RepID=UPI00260B785A|nr:LLM class F420-dependent oxidoreductase [Saccharomonospora sp.]